MSHDFLIYCIHNGIKRQLSQAKTPQQNGVAERRNRTIIERARSMVVEARLPRYLWTEAVNTANYIVNLSPTSANLGMTPEQRYSGKTPTVTHLKVFGNITFVHIPKTNRKKLETKTMRCIFLGYDTESKVYRLYNPIQKKILLSQDVTIDESRVGFHHLSESNPQPVTYLPSNPSETSEPVQDLLENPGHFEISDSHHAPSEFEQIGNNLPPSSSPNSPRGITSPPFINPSQTPIRLKRMDSQLADTL
jgi:hypothetical protein